MTTALLIIDVQNALCSGAYEAFDSRRVINRINAVSAASRQAKIPVIVIQHEEPGDVMAFGADGWQLDPELLVGTDDILVRKTTPDSFHNTELRAILQARGVDELMVCGLQTEYCVDTTARRALALGYPVTLVSDGHTTLDNGVLSAAQIIAHHNQTLSHMGSFGPRVTVVAAADVKVE